MDGIIPLCRTEQGCLIPQLRPAGERVLTFRAMRVRLAELVDPGTVSRAFAREFGPLEWDDLELLAITEDELKAGAPLAAPEEG